MEEGFERKLEKRKEKVKNFLFNKKNLVLIIGIIVLLLLTWHIRTANVEGLKDVTTGNYTLGPDLDPFLFLRYAKYIVENGKLMEHDSLRNVPSEFDTAQETRLLPYMIAYFHKAISIFTNKDVTYSAILFPAFMFVLTSLIFFLFVRKIFENKKYSWVMALVSTAFLIISLPLLPRTVAGIPEKESAAFFFMILAFYFFISAWKSEKLKKGIILSSLAGVSTAMMTLIWGGSKYIFLSISLFVFIEFIIGKVNIKRLWQFLFWMFFSVAITIIFFSPKYTLFQMITASTSSGAGFLVLGLLLVDRIIFKTKIKDIKIVEKTRKKIPDRIFSVIAFIIIGIILAVIVLGVDFVYSYLKELVYIMALTGTDRLSFTVAENKKPFFTDWRDNFGPVFNGIPVLFWLFFAGSVFLFYDAVKRLKLKTRIALTSTYTIFLFSFIFSRYSGSGIMNGESLESRIVYFGGYLLLLVVAGFFFYKYSKEKNLEEFEKINSSYILLLIFFIVSMVGARSAIRLVMVLSIPTAAIIGYFSVVGIEYFKEHDKDVWKLIFGILAAVVIFASLYVFYYNYQASVGSVKSIVPSSYTQQWQQAMAWVRENTKEDSVFAHWWDYGYWIQSIGNRATVLDGGNYISYWNYLLGRHVLTGQNEKEALEFLYTHDADYLLIDSTDIGKYGAYSSIGSDENYDRYSQIATFTEDERNMQETKSEFIHLYQGNQFLDEDYRFDNNGNEEYLPAYQTGIGGVFVVEGKDGTLKQPIVVFVYQGKQINLPLKCIYLNGKKYDFGLGYGGCLYIVPRLANEDGNMFIKNSGTALFLTERTMRALWVKLYLFNEGENFELVHTEDSFVVRDLKNQGQNFGDFIYWQGVQGAIKIWKINYPSDIEKKEEYLNTDYPESLRKTKQVF